MMKRSKRILLRTLAICMAAACGCSLFGGITEHIEDTNGPDNYTLQTITDQDICQLSTGSMGDGQRNALLSDLPVFFSKKFSGVSVIEESSTWASGMTIDVYNYRVEEGNFRLLVMVDDQILHEFIPNGDVIQTCQLGEINGHFSIRIAGESAAYEFSYDKW